MEGNAKPQPPQKFTEQGLLHWISKQQQEGKEIYTCYEIGPMGFVLHRQLTKMGVHNLVVQPQNWDELGKGQKTDSLDALAMVTRLDRHLAGNTKSFSTVYVPTLDEQKRKEISRTREEFKKNRKRLAAQGGSILRLNGISKYLNGWWKPTAWKEIEATLDAHLVRLLSFRREVILKLNEQEQKLIEELEGAQSSKQILGLGEMTSEVLCREVVNWNRFTNRRSVVSYAGLCPRQHSSGKKVVMGSITKHGNPLLRTYAIELAWRWTRFQPKYRGTLQFQKLCQKGGSKKKAIVAMARLIVIDLWRIFTKQIEAEKVGLQMKAT
jgi:transposase